MQALNMKNTINNILFKPYQGFSKETWRLLAAGFVNAMGLMIVVYISLYLNKMHYSVNDIGNFLAFFGVFGVVGGYCGGALTEYFTPLEICKVSLLMSAILLLFFPILNNYYNQIVVAGLLSFF